MDLHRLSLTIVYWRFILPVVGVKLLLHLYVNTIYGIHRDGLLYLALGRHPDWGYWSNPPLIGWLSWLIQHIGGDAVWVVRLFPTLAGCGIVLLAGMMAREFGGGRYAQFLATLGAAVSPAFLRTSMLFQPVVFDVLGWAIFSWLLVRYLNTSSRRYILAFGAAFGLFFLNKYMVVFFLAALAPALLLTRYRAVLWSRDAAMAAGIALLIMLPNLVWQVMHDFPVVSHMRELRANQLVNVQPANFLVEQLFLNFSGTLVWLPGLWFLWTRQEGRYRSILFLFAGVILLLLALQGKPYYTLGMYPVMMAAGGWAWENLLHRRWLRLALPLLLVVLLIPGAPLALPLFPPSQMAEYCRWAGRNLGLDFVTRWEDGRQHPLPQDFADMLGWPEIGQAATDAFQQLPPGTPVMIYGENYGQAGAVDYFGRRAGLPPAVSFADTYRLWLPETTQATALIYINDELGPDVAALFSDIRPIGSVRDTFAREFGTTVYLCRQPRKNLGEFWRERVAGILSNR